MANLMLSVMGAFAEFGCSLIRERQREGIALAKHAAASEHHQRDVEIGSEYEIVGPESSSASCQAAKSVYVMNE